MAKFDLKAFAASREIQDMRRLLAERAKQSGSTIEEELLALMRADAPPPPPSVGPGLKRAP